MKTSILLARFACAVLLLVTGLQHVVQAAAPGASEIAWRAAANDADIAQVFALARKGAKPVLLYWGASWCPPCNKLKATLFNRQDFIAQSRAFVAVNVDGDLPSAQKLGTKFKVRGYPTLILFNPQGAELTRLPGEAEPAQILDALHLALAGGRSARDLLADARAGKNLSANDWRTLAYYSWDTDESQLIPASDQAAMLADLARQCPISDDDITTRLWLKALAGSDSSKAVVADDALRAQVSAVLLDALRSRQQMDVLVTFPRELLRALAEANSPARHTLLTQFDAALERLQLDGSISRADRVSALTARVELARIDQADDSVFVTLPDPLQSQLREMASSMDHDISNGYERQAVIPEVAFTLSRAGLWKESDALLKANLARSHSPYYLMSQLGGNARKQGRTSEAINWYSQAYAGSRGPATRLQWGASYVIALVELVPDDAEQITTAVTQIFAEAARDGSAFHERSARSLKRIADKLAVWNAAGGHDAEVAKIAQQFDAICKKLPSKDPQHATCVSILASTKGV